MTTALAATGDCPTCRGRDAMTTSGALRKHRADGTKSGPLCPGSGPQIMRTQPEPVEVASPNLMATGFGVSLGWAC